MPDLLALTLTLQPLPAASAQPAPAWWGRAIHSLWLDAVAQLDPTQAQILHDASGPRPYTLSNLLGRFPHRQLAAEETYRFRITTLTNDLSALLLRAVQTGPLAPGAAVTLDYHGFRVMDVDWSEGLWTGEADYTTLAARHLARDAQPARQITFRLTSPTGFRSRKRHAPVPLPELLFGSLLQRWNAFAPLAFPDEVRRYAEECLAIARFDLKTRVVPMKNQGKRPGAVGEIRYVTLNYDRYWMSVMHALADFARFSGVGVSVTLGMGQVRAEV